MDPINLSQRYFDAWIRRDADAILATIAPGGTYQDPTTPGPLSGEALRGYVQGLWAAFPDLRFELGQVHLIGARRVFAEWKMVGSNTGSMNGLPPTGKTVRLPGIDVIEIGSDGIHAVTGYFDSAVVPRQLGLDVIVQPSEIGPFRFGTGTVVRLSKPMSPGVVGITELLASSDEAVPHIRQLVRQTVIEQLQVPGFLAFTATVTGRRMTTVSMWDTQQSMRAGMSNGTHAQAMREFFGAGIAEGGSTSVFAPVRVGPYWRRCDACRQMTRLAERSGHCQCGEPLEAVA